MGTQYVKMVKTGESPHGTLHAEMHWLLNVALSRSGKGVGHRQNLSRIASCPSVLRNFDP